MCWLYAPSPKNSGSCLIRRSSGQSLLATHRGLSQPAASFIVAFCLGIHHTPLITSIPNFRISALFLRQNFCCSPKTLEKSRVRILVSHSTKLLSFPIISTVVKTFAIARRNCPSILPLSFSPVKHLPQKKCCFFATTVFCW